ncbi:MAG TPA: hypothetical protein VJ697_16795 [Nitrososphaeraceae archaeon]|nr:hypothetical protein [Nitrososphaeraceae archaeon]
MAKFVKMDYRVKFADQIEGKIIGSVMLINKYNVEPNKVEQFLKVGEMMLLTLNNNQDLFLHNYIEVLVRVLFSLIMLFGSQWNIISKRLIKYCLLLNHNLHF